MPKNSKAATAMPPPAAKSLSNGLRTALLVAAVVVTVRVDVAEPVPVISAAGAEQVGRLVAPDGLVAMAQLKLTLPVNPPVGVTVKVLVPVAPGLETVTAGIDPSEKLALAAAVTEKSTGVVSVRFPDVPVTVAM